MSLPEEELSLPGQNKKSNGVLLEGYLWKRGRVNKAFRQRYFILSDSCDLTYYKSPPPSSRPIASICCMHALPHLRAPSPEHQHVFDIVTPSRTYHFLADTRAEMEKWMGTLVENSQVAAENQELDMLDELIREVERGEVRDFRGTESKKVPNVFSISRT